MNITESEKSGLLACQELVMRGGQIQRQLDDEVRSSQILQFEKTRAAALANASDLRSQADLIGAEIKKVEVDLELVVKRIDRDEDLLKSSANAKDIAGLEHELASLRQRQDALETRELELMDSAEILGKELSISEAAVEAAQLSLTHAVQERDSRIQALRDEHERLIAERDALLGQFTTELRNLVLQLWSRGSGIGRLQETTCTCCHVGLNSSAINELKKVPSETLVQCPECRAILIR